MGLSDKFNASRGPKPQAEPSLKKDEKNDEKTVANISNNVVNIGTNVDGVYNAVVEKKSLALNELAVIFKVSLSKIEEWARMLDKQGLLELYYPVVGGPVLRVKGTIASEHKPVKKSKKMLSFFIFSVVFVAAIIFVIIKLFYTK